MEVFTDARSCLLMHVLNLVRSKVFVLRQCEAAYTVISFQIKTQWPGCGHVVQVLPSPVGTTVLLWSLCCSGRGSLPV